MKLEGLKSGVAVAFALTASFVDAAAVSKVKIESLSSLPVDPEAIEAYTKIHEGLDVKGLNELRGLLADDVKNLRDSGRFTFVSADAEQYEDGTLGVVYRVKRKAFIREITVTGTDDIRVGKFLKKLDLKENDLVDDLVLASKVRGVKEYYAKHHYPYLDAQWALKQNPNGSVDVEIVVTEGIRFKVNKIIFEGNTIFKEDELREVMMQKKRRWWSSWITGSGTYKPEVVDGDIVALRSLYQDRGYLDAEVSDPVLEKLDNGKGVLKIKIEEGQPYKIGNVTFDDPTIYDRSVIAEKVTIKAGDTASMSAIDKVGSNIQLQYGNNGYIRSSAKPTITPTEIPNVVDVHYQIREGNQAYINKVEIRGNTVTKDKVLRRELAVAPGEKYHQGNIDASANRLRNLGFFSKVQDLTERVDGDKYDLIFDVEEQSTGQFMIGGGFSSVDSLVGFVEVSQGNFDIGSWPPVGAGQKARVRAQVGSERTDLLVSFTEPWFLDRRLSLGVDLYHREASYFSDYFEQVTDGAKFTLTKPLTAHDRISFAYSLEQISIEDLEDDTPWEIAREEYTNLKSQLRVAVTHDTRDNYFIPKRGNRSIAAVHATGGPLGGDQETYGLELTSSQYWPVFNKHVFNIRGAYRVVDTYGSSDEVPVYDRLFLGGQRNVRGFDYREVGPFDSTGREAIGGKTSYYTTFEYTVPLWKKVRGAMFYDMGFVSKDAYSTDFNSMNSGAGIGLRFDMPGMPLQLDYAWPLVTDEYNDDGGQFTFQMGYTL